MDFLGDYLTFFKNLKTVVMYQNGFFDLFEKSQLWILRTAMSKWGGVCCLFLFLISSPTLVQSSRRPNKEWLAASQTKALLFLDFLSYFLKKEIHFMCFHFHTFLVFHNKNCISFQLWFDVNLILLHVWASTSQVQVKPFRIHLMTNLIIFWGNHTLKYLM